MAGGEKKKIASHSKETLSKTESLCLDDILELGGTKADLELLAGIDESDNEDTAEFGDDLEVEAVKINEVKDFITKLGIFEHRPKDLPEENVVEEEKEVQESDASELKESSKKKKKKNKYKIQDDEVSSSSSHAASSWNPMQHIRFYKPRKYLLVKAGSSWLEETSTEPSTKEAPENIVQKMEEFASKLLQDEVALYNKQRENSRRSEAKWLKTVLGSGTLSDKVAALTLLAQESPVHSLSSIESLLNMCKKKGRRESTMGVDTLRDLFLSDLLPDNRKLKTFSQHPLLSVDELSSGNRDVVDKKLILWHFESKLKEIYSEFVKTLDKLSHDMILSTKEKALSSMFRLLSNKPEQENVLLPFIVNKLGDPDYKLASKACHFLTKLVIIHPNMKGIVLEAVENLVYRPNISQKAQYYAMCFLNQLVLNQSDQSLALRLIDVYFSFFKSFVKKGEVDSKMMAALLSGVNRAYPFAKVDSDYFIEQMNMLFKIVHIVNFNTSLQALMLLQQVMDASHSGADRYYMALYKKLADPSLKTSSKHALFLNLLFKSLTKDVSEKRIKAFAKRLLQVCSYQSPPFVCGALVLLSEVIKGKPGVMNFKQVFVDSDDEEHFTDFPESEEFKLNSGSSGYHSNSDEEQGESLVGSGSKTQSSWMHRQNISRKSDTGDYDPYFRNPLYCRADQECIWELKKLVQHYHPTVSLFAQTLLENRHVEYTGDPLQDFTLKRFLDRFVYKNPKKSDQVAEKAGLSMSRRKVFQSKGVKGIPVNSDNYIQRGESQIPVDEKFFFKYFSQKAVRDKKKGKDDDSDVSDTEFDAYLDSFEKGVDVGTTDIDFDFARELGKRAKANKKKGKKKEESSSEEEEEDEDDEMSDDELDFSEDEELAKAFKDEMNNMQGEDDDDDDDDDIDDKEFDEENIAFSDDDEFSEMGGSSKKGKRRLVDSDDSDLELTNGKKRRKDKNQTSGLFAAAEEFAHLIDDNAESSLDTLGTQAMSNKDQAGIKQLRWEADRDRWIKGQDWKSKKRSQKGKMNFKHKGFKPKPQKQKQKQKQKKK
ncbi:CCAAT/enhancer-binding protein zeta-like [Gigantopelta aegis]|uniref:CCAAT/enhancer-binding protein zeta-like n=1 Tax=Gigantopelta aegis TaxID=1735272 RepID=UPI001B88E77C|nr:CCAAT/enhancer-binding protein zeta-like [Gigantopelta aegis]